MQTEAQIRDAKGEWRPSPLPVPSPLFNGPWKPLVILKHLWNVIWPYNLIYAAMAFVCWLYLTPSLETTAHFGIDWIALLYLRNVLLLVIVAGALHLRLYIKQAQGIRFKYTDKWLAANDRKFTFGNQTRDNVFWSLVSGCIIWTAYEAVTLWAFSNQIIPYLDMRQYPIYAVLLTLAVVYFRYFHFYFIHRLIHWKPLYKLGHSLHHRNINVGPWSGLSMHPIEHLFYFSCVFFNWIVPSSPLPCHLQSAARRHQSCGRAPRLPPNSRQRRYVGPFRQLLPLSASSFLHGQFRRGGFPAGLVVQDPA